MLNKYKLRDYNFRLVIEVMILNIFGILVVGSAKPSVQNKQILGMILGLCVMVFFSLLDYEIILKFNWLIYAGTILMLASILFLDLGDEAKGAQRWIEIGGFRFQPSELAKILLILFQNIKMDIL